MMEQILKYKAVFPGKWGDEITRVYNTKSVAIRETKKHLAACQDCNTSHFGEVYECSMTFDGHCNRIRLIFEMES